MTPLGQVPADCSCDGAVIEQIEEGANAGEQSARKTLKRDPDVMADVVPEHHPVTLRRTADGGGRVRIHLLVGGCRFRADYRQNQLRPLVDQPADDKRWNVKQRSCYPDVR